jgi:hypothetical protein
MNLGPIISVPPVVSKLSRGASCPAKRAPRSVTNANLAWVQSSTERVPVFGSAHARQSLRFIMWKKATLEEKLPPIESW